MLNTCASYSQARSSRWRFQAHEKMFQLSATPLTYIHWSIGLLAVCQLLFKCVPAIHIFWIMTCSIDCGTKCSLKLCWKTGSIIKIASGVNGSKMIYAHLLMYPNCWSENLDMILLIRIYGSIWRTQASNNQTEWKWKLKQSRVLGILTHVQLTLLLISYVAFKHPTQPRLCTTFTHDFRIVRCANWMPPNMLDIRKVTH